MTLTSETTYIVDGQTAYVIRGIHGLNPRVLSGTTVVLNGNTVIVRRVETNAVIDPAGQSFSVIVEPVPHA